MTSAERRADVGPVGLIGIGLLGSAIARRLIAAGSPVVGYDRDPARLTALAGLGGIAAGSAIEAASAGPRLVLCLPDLPVSAEVLEEVAPSLRPGSLVIDTTTGDPAMSEALAARLRHQEVDYLDATISGSSAAVEAGEAALFVGGAVEAFGRAGDLLAAITPRPLHAGPAGAGSRLKLVTNLVLGLNRAALAEGLAFAAAIGVEPGRALEALRSSAAWSRVMEAKGPKMVARDFSPQARLAQHRKDVRLMLEAADREGLDLPLSRAHAALLDLAIAAGLGESDNSALLRIYDGGDRDGR